MIGLTASLGTDAHLPAETARTSTSFTIFEGTSEIQRVIIGRALTGLDVCGNSGRSWRACRTRQGLVACATTRRPACRVSATIAAACSALTGRTTAAGAREKLALSGSLRPHIRRCRECG